MNNKIILSTIVFLISALVNFSYASTNEEEIQRSLYESLNQENQELEVIKHTARSSANWPSTHLSSAIPKVFSWYGAKFNIYLWRDSSDNVWVKIVPIESRPFICGPSFDIFQDGDFRLQDNGSGIVKLEQFDSSSICGFVSEPSIYKLVIWSFLTAKADLSQPFDLFHDGDASDDRESSISLNTYAVTEDNLNKSNQLFDFVEKNYPQYFSPSGMETFIIQGYLARYYSKTDTYVGTLGQDVYVYGNVFNGLLFVGKISDFIKNQEPLGICIDNLPEPMCDEANFMGDIPSGGVSLHFESGSSCSSAFPEYEYEPNEEGSEYLCSFLECGACAMDYEQ